MLCSAFMTGREAVSMATPREPMHAQRCNGKDPKPMGRNVIWELSELFRSQQLYCMRVDSGTRLSELAVPNAALAIFLFLEAATAI